MVHRGHRFFAGSGKPHCVEHRREARVIVFISTPFDCAPERQCIVHDELIPDGTNIRLALLQREFYIFCDLISFYHFSLMILSFFIHPAPAIQCIHILNMFSLTYGASPAVYYYYYYYYYYPAGWSRGYKI